MPSARYQTNRFKIPAENADAVLSAVNAGLCSDDGAATIAVRPCETSEDQPALCECFITGPGKPRYETEGVSAGILKMTGNMDAFYKAVQPLLAQGEAMLFISYRNDDDHLNIDGCTVTSESIDKLNFMQELIRIAADKTGDEHWSTDFHSFGDPGEQVPSTEEGGEGESSISQEGESSASTAADDGSIAS